MYRLKQRLSQKLYTYFLGVYRRSFNDPNRLYQKKLHVTDHAYARYFERVHDLDLKRAYLDITSEHLLERVQAAGGNGSFRVQGFIVRVHKYKVVTVLDDVKDGTPSWMPIKV